MSFTVKTKKPQLDDTTSDNTAKTGELNKSNQSEPSTSYEVFRNNTTAVEVIVKEVMSKNKKKLHVEPSITLQTIRRLREEIETLEYQLAKSNSMLSKSRNSYRLIILEMKKQLDTVNKQELERQKENMSLLLENEKLKALLELKTNLVLKFKRELNTMKRVLKMIIKNMTCIPQIGDSNGLNSDPEFDDFERDLKKEVHAKFPPNVFDDLGVTFDSTIAKDGKDSLSNVFM